MVRRLAHLLTFALALFVLPLFLSASPRVAGQEADRSVLVASFTEDGFQIYAVDTAGQQTLVASLPASRIGDPADKNRWDNGNSAGLTLSPDGGLLAFTAHRGGKWSLFVYDLAESILTERSLPANPRLVWSPDSSAILLTRNSTLPYNDFVYEVVGERLVQLTHTKYGESSFGWLPDSSGLFYVGLYRECETCRAASQALYVVTRDGSETRLLAIGSELTRGYSDDSVCWPTWSEPNQRIYFIVGCVAEGATNEYLYSVDLTGDVRLEIIGGLNYLNQSEFNVWTRNIHPSPTTRDLYLTVASQGGEEDQRRMLSNWRILHLSAVGEVVRIYEKVMQNDSLTSSRISPEGTAIALIMYGQGSSNGFMEIIDLVTGQRIIGPDATPLDICDVSWADETTLFYGVDPTGACDITRAPQSVWVLDTISGATQEVTVGLGDHVSMVRQEYVMGRNIPY